MNLRHVSLGTGKKTMVVVPGLSIRYVTDETETLKKVFAQFFDDYTVYVFDVRDDVPENYSIEQMSEDLASAVKALGLRDIYLYGCSMGGMESLLLAGNYPSLVKKLAVGASAVKSNATSRGVIGNWIRLAKSGAYRELVSDMGRLIFTQEICNQNGDAFNAMADGLTETVIARFIHTAEAVYHVDIVQGASGITCPVLALGSKGDKVLTSDASVEIAAVTNGELYLYGEEYPHAVYDLAPDFKTRVKGFFDSQH